MILAYYPWSNYEIQSLDLQNVIRSNLGSQKNILSETNLMQRNLIYMASEIILCKNGFDEFKGIAQNLIQSQSDIKTRTELVNKYTEVFTNFNSKLSTVNIKSIACPNEKELTTRLREIYNVVLSRKSNDDGEILSIISTHVFSVMLYIINILTVKRINYASSNNLWFPVFNLLRRTKFFPRP